MTLDPADHDVAAPGRAPGEQTGFCPVCGAELLWISTARLWPSRRAAQAVLPSYSGDCPDCHRSLMFAVVHDPSGDAGGETK